MRERSYNVFGEKESNITTDKKRMGIFINLKSNIYDTVIALADHWLDAQTETAKRMYRDVYDRYIDSLAEDGEITDNQAEFLELWLVMLEND